MLLLHQLKTWIYWKTKIRILQLWSNYKLFNFNNPYLMPILSSIGPLIGILLMFVFGFGLSYFFKYFISENPYHLWQVVFFITMIEAFDRGLQNGRWISSTNEEGWLLASTPFTTTKYLLFLWVDEEFWQNKTQFLSSLSFLLGVYVLFPVNFGKLLIAIVILTLLGTIIALITTLIQYYIIKKSVYLKGRGMISNILYPLIASILGFFGIKYFMPWIISFPKVINDQFYKDYLDWLKGIFEPLWDFSKQIVSLFNYDLYPHSLLSNYLLTDNLKAVVYLCLYFVLFLLISLLMFKLIERKRNKIIIEKSKLDNVFLAFFMKVNTFFQLFNKHSLKVTHVKYFMSSLLQNYLTRRNIFAVFGGRLWIYLALTISIVLYTPVEYKAKIALISALVVVVVYPTSILWAVYSKLKIKLSFDAEGPHLQVLMGYGASPEYIYKLKTRVLQILVFPGYVLLLLLSLIILPISWYFVVLLTLVSLIVFWIVSNFVVLPSFVLPHYEFFNKQQIGEYPDQIKALNLIQTTINLLILPGIPLLMYATGVIQPLTFIVVSLLWILIGGSIAFLVMKNVYNLRLNNFTIEEMSLSRLKVIDEGYWKKRIPLLVITILIYLGTAVLTLTGEFLFAGLLYLIPMISINLILLSSFRKTI